MTDWRLRIGLLFVGVIGVMGVLGMLGEAGVTLTDVPFFLIGVATSFILLWCLFSILPDWWESAISLLVFILPPFVGGFITGEPALGAVIGVILWLPSQRGWEGDEPSDLALISRSIPHIISSIGGFIGGLLRKMLF